MAIVTAEDRNRLTASIWSALDHLLPHSRTPSRSTALQYRERHRLRECRSIMTKSLIGDMG